MDYPWQHQYFCLKSTSYIINDPKVILWEKTPPLSLIIQKHLPFSKHLRPVWYMCLKIENYCLKTFVEIRTCGYWKWLFENTNQTPSYSPKPPKGSQYVLQWNTTATFQIKIFFKLKPPSFLGKQTYYHALRKWLEVSVKCHLSLSCRGGAVLKGGGMAPPKFGNFFKYIYIYIYKIILMFSKFSL